MNKTNENNLNKEEKERNINYEAIKNRNHNKLHILLVLLIATGYIFFLTSQFVFHEHPSKQYTELFDAIPFKSGTLRVESWKYSEEQKLCEVCCSFTDIGDENKIQISASANYSYLTKGATVLETEILYIDNGYFVAAVYGMPEDWYCSALYVNYNNTIKSTYPSSSEMYEETISENERNKATVYTCIDDVERVDLIEKQDEKSYKIEHCNRSIGQDEKLLDEYIGEIDNLNASIADYQYQIQQLEAKMALQTTAEQEQSQNKIDEYKRNIEFANDSITKINSSIETLQTDIEEYKEIIENINKMLN